MDDRRPAPDTSGPSDRYPGTPAWVKALGILAILVVLALLLAVVTGLGGSHGPQRHSAPASVLAFPDAA